MYRRDARCRGIADAIGSHSEGRHGLAIGRRAQARSYMSASVPDGSRGASSAERFRREAKAGRGLSETDDVPRLPCLYASLPRWRSRASYGQSVCSATTSSNCGLGLGAGRQGVLTNGRLTAVDRFVRRRTS